MNRASSKHEEEIGEEEKKEETTATGVKSQLPPTFGLRHHSSMQLAVIDKHTHLHKVLGESQITNIQKVFNAKANQQVNPDELRHILLVHGKAIFHDNDFYHMTFQRMNIKRDGYVSWDEFISYLIFSFRVEEVSEKAGSLVGPINKKARIVKSNHRHPINRIAFNFQVHADRSYSYDDGSYITLSHDGYINYWSLDMRMERSEQSKSVELTISSTWVMSIAILADVSVLCTGSTERDLRFYDTSARKFELRVHMHSCEFAVSTMAYSFPKDPNEDAKLILGDMNGNVRIILFSPIGRGPFRSKTVEPLLSVPFARVEKGLVPGFKVTTFRNLHKDWVRQIEFYNTMNLIVSCSTSPRSLVMHSVNIGGSFHAYHVPKGVWCFACADGVPLLATGGPDCQVRIWNPFITRRPVAVLLGHHTGVVSVIFQDKGEILCSLSEDKGIIVWDVATRTNKQTFLGLGKELGEYTTPTMFYNPNARQLIVGGMVIAVLPLRPLPNGEHTDGNSHTASISVILYNKLFKMICTCGLDSKIIVWDPFTGKRISVINDAHTRHLHGEVLPVDITAACFDPGEQLLVTGAFDGTLKTWSFNNASCLRNMRIEHGCEVTAVCWIRGRILATGWNRHVTEFADVGSPGGPDTEYSKMWTTRHTDDVLCAAVRTPQTLATSSYNGELVLWKLETGQPYKQYQVANPTNRVKVAYKFEKPSRHEKPVVTALSQKYGLKKDIQKAVAAAAAAKSKTLTALSKQEEARREELEKVTLESSFVSAMKLTRQCKPLVLPKTICPIRGLAIRCILFLTTRPMKVNVGTLLVALENGDIQVWSHHTAGGFLGAFQAVHAVGDYVVSMCADEKEEYLFTGSTAGYVKTFHLVNFFTGEEEQHVCMPRLRLIFPFLWRRVFPGRAQRALGGQLKPLLLNSYKAHRHIVSGIIFIQIPRILATASADFSARVWTLGGRYLGTLGTFKPWTPIDPDTPVDEVSRNFSIPPDIHRVMSSTTRRVLLAEESIEGVAKKETASDDDLSKYGWRYTYGQKLQPPFLGNYMSIPPQSTRKFKLRLNTTFPFIPVYQHLIRPVPVDIPLLQSGKRRKESVALKKKK